MSEENASPREQIAAAVREAQSLLPQLQLGKPQAAADITARLHEAMNVVAGLNAAGATCIEALRPLLLGDPLDATMVATIVRGVFTAHDMAVTRLAPVSGACGHPACVSPLGSDFSILIPVQVRVRGTVEQVWFHRECARVLLNSLLVRDLGH